MMLGLALAAAMAVGAAQDAGAASADEAARAEACGAYDAMRATRFPDGESAPPGHYAARDAARDRCIALGGSGPTWYDLHLQLSIAQRNREATEALEAAIALEPDNPEYLFARGMDAWENTQTGGGADIERALRLDEPDREIYELRVSHFWALEALEYDGRHEAIVLLTNRLIETERPTAGRHMARGLALATLGQPEAALADLDAALALNTVDLQTSDFLALNGGQGVRGMILRARGLVLTRLGRGREAVADLEAGRRLTLRDDDPALDLALCRAWIETGDRAGIRRACDATGDERSPALRAASAAYRGLSLERAGRSGPARRAYAQALELGTEAAAIGLSQEEAYVYRDGLETARAGLARLGGR